MHRFFLAIVLALIFMLGNLDARNIKKGVPKDACLPSTNPQEVPTFNAVSSSSANEPRRRTSHRHHQKSSLTTTTPSPFVSYWQNLVRNVRVPVPSITWNVKNPLANLFNTVQDDDFVPLEDDEAVEDYYTESNPRRHRNKKRRKPHNKKQRKHKHPHQRIGEAEQQEIDLANLATQQMMLPQYGINDNIDLNMPTYFFDPATNAYYTVQRVRALTTHLKPHRIKKEQEFERPTKEQANNGENYIDDQEESDDDDDINSNEAEEIDLDKVSKNEKSNTDEVDHKPDIVEKPKNEFSDEETVRNVLGNFMLDDSHNRQRQRSKEKQNVNNYKQLKSRKLQSYYFLVNV